jgi:hypothetical protein
MLRCSFLWEFVASASNSPRISESQVWLEARQFVRKKCRPDRLCAARLKAKQFVIKITNHKKSFGIAPITELLRRGANAPPSPEGAC